MPKDARGDGCMSSRLAAPARCRWLSRRSRHLLGAPGHGEGHDPVKPNRRPLELVAAQKRHRVQTSPATRGLGCDENVEIGHLPVPYPVDDRDLPRKIRSGPSARRATPPRTSSGRRSPIASSWDSCATSSGPPPPSRSSFRWGALWASRHREEGSVPAAPPRRHRRRTTRGTSGCSAWGGNANLSGQSTTSNSSYSGNFSANRTTEAWKFNFSARYSRRESDFGVDVVSLVKDWNASSLLVKSLTPQWSLGARAGTGRSTRVNEDLRWNISPGIEYNFVPYSESSRRRHASPPRSHSRSTRYSRGVASAFQSPAPNTCTTRNLTTWRSTARSPIASSADSQ